MKIIDVNDGIFGNPAADSSQVRFQCGKGNAFVEMPCESFHGIDLYDTLILLRNRIAFLIFRQFFKVGYRDISKNIEAVD